MKIVFNTDQVYLHGGIENVMAIKANYWVAQKDTEVYIVTTEQQGYSPCYPLDPRVKLIDLKVNYNRSKSYFSPENIKKAIKHFRAQKKVFNKIKPDIIISPNFNFDHYWLPFQKSKAKVIKERHGSRYMEVDARKSTSFSSRLKFLFNDWLDSKYHKIVVLNDDEKQYVMSNNAVVIPNPIHIPESRATLEKKQVLAAGRISPVKNFADLVCAWEIVRAKYPDWQLHFYGEDYLNTKSTLDSLIQEKKLNDVVSFQGTTSNMTETMLDYSIYVMSSITECFPMVLLESLSVGLPIVSYDSPNGPRNIVTHQQDGIITSYMDPNKLAEAIIYLIENNSRMKEMGENAKKNAERFSIDNVMRKWNKIINLKNV